MMALVTINESTFAVLGVLVLRLHEDLFDGCVSLQVFLYTILTTCLFYAFGYTFCVWDDNLSYCGLVTLSFDGWIAALVAVISNSIIVFVGVVVVGWIVVACILLLLFKTFCCTLLMAQEGQLHLPSAR